MNITISREGQQFGPYTLEQVNGYLASGQFSHSDLAFHEGVSQWVPLSTVTGVLAPPPPAPLPPPPSKRNTGKLVLMAFLWLIAFWFGGIMAVGFIAGVLNPNDAENAGGAAGEAFSGIFLLAGIGLSVWLTIAGKLPGTK